MKRFRIQFGILFVLVVTSIAAIFFSWRLPHYQKPDLIYVRGISYSYVFVKGRLTHDLKGDEVTVSFDGNFAVKDSDLVHLATMKKLKFIEIGDSSLTEGCLKVIQESLPGDILVATGGSRIPEKVVKDLKKSKTMRISTSPSILPKLIATEEEERGK